MDARLLAERLAAVPRLSLETAPTPLEFLPALSRALGRPVYLKRDDQCGPAPGGNKARKLAYILAAARRSGRRRVATYGAPQSNHARLVAALAPRLGLEPHLFYFIRRPDRLTGNLLLCHLLGARLHFIPLRSQPGRWTIERTDRLVHLLAWLWLGPHTFIPVGGHSVLGALGYVQAALELEQQARAQGLEQAWVVVATGTGGTLAGLWAGLTLLGSALRPLGIDIGALWRDLPRSIARLAERVCARLGAPRRFDPAAVPLVTGYAAPGYGQPSPLGNRALRQLARLEGVLLDPVYTAKAFGGLLDLQARGSFGPTDPVIFLHTGGLPALFAVAPDDLLSAD